MLGELLVLYHEQLLGLAASPPSSGREGPLTDESHAKRLDVTPTESSVGLTHGAPSPRDRDQNSDSGIRTDISDGASDEQANKTSNGYIKPFRPSILELSG